jgi:hypothetical protein
MAARNFPTEVAKKTHNSVLFVRNQTAERLDCSLETNWKEKNYLEKLAIRAKSRSPDPSLRNFFDVLFIEDLQYLVRKLDFVHRLALRIESSRRSVGKLADIDTVIDLSP